MTEPTPRLDLPRQLCVMHLVRNALRYASKEHWAAVTRDLKAIYTAPTVEAAEAAFAECRAACERAGNLTGRWDRTTLDALAASAAPGGVMRIGLARAARGRSTP